MNLSAIKTVTENLNMVFTTEIERGLKQLEDLVAEYREVADEASYYYALDSLEQLKRKAAHSNLNNDELEVLFSSVLKQNHALALAIYEWQKTPA